MKLKTATILLSKMSNQRRVYVENMKDIMHNSVYCVYYGSSLEELKNVFHEKLPTHPSLIFEFYTKRIGMSHRALCPDELPPGLDEIFVRLRLTDPVNCPTCGPKNNTHST